MEGIVHYHIAGTSSAVKEGGGEGGEIPAVCWRGIDSGEQAW